MSKDLKLLRGSNRTCPAYTIAEANRHKKQGAFSKVRKIKKNQKAIASYLALPKITPQQ
jgi:hypothetical protein